MYLGLDLGTSGVKAVLLDSGGTLIGQATAPLSISNPRHLWSEQNPADWWQAVSIAVACLRADRDLSGVRGIGLCGQMHGAVLLDHADKVLRPAILWNGGRSQAECEMLEAAEPRLRAITGNLVMPGFTAPKLLWVRRHERAVFDRTAHVLLPKDWLRLRLTGEKISEMSDASGTLWLDVGVRCWSDAMLGATGLTQRHMPALVEGTQQAGGLRADIAADWGLPAGCVVAGGAGDNAAGAIGIGCIAPDQAFLSLGTSGVIFVTDRAFMPNPDRTVHAFCHCLPDRWHRMSVILSAAAAFGWVTRLTGAPDEASLLREIAASRPRSQERLVFLPYLSGERTPHNDPTAAGVFFGLNPSHDRAALGRAVLEGVAFALADGLDALETRGGRIDRLTVIGGGARGTLWPQIMATVLDRPLSTVHGGDVGPALGAARLAVLAREGDDPASICHAPTPDAVFQPGGVETEGLLRRRALFRDLYPALRDLFACSSVTADNPA